MNWRTQTQEWQHARAWGSEAGRAPALPAFAYTSPWARPKVGGDWAAWLEGAAASAAHSPAASAGEATAKTAARAVGTR